MILNFGSDPEFLLTDKATGEWIPPFGPHMDKLENWHEDGVNFELLTPPFSRFKNLLRFIREEINYISEELNANISTLPINKVPDTIFEYDKCTIFGCQPDINTLGRPEQHTPKELRALAKSNTRRPAGGHVHISAENLFTDDESWKELVDRFNQYQENPEIVTQEDVMQLPAWKSYETMAAVVEANILILAWDAALELKEINPDFNIDLEQERRLLYGRAGDSRPKLYEVDGKVYQGIEVRSPSPIWTMISPRSKAPSEFQKNITTGIKNVRDYRLEEGDIHSVREYLLRFPDLHEPYYDIIFQVSIDIDTVMEPIEPVIVEGTFSSASNGVNINYSSIYSALGKR